MTQCNLIPIEKTENMLLATAMLIEPRIAMFPSREDNLIKLTIYIKRMHLKYEIQQKYVLCRHD